MPHSGELKTVAIVTEGFRFMIAFLKCHCLLCFFFFFLFQDPNVQLIRELRSEIDRLKSIIRKTESGDEVKVFILYNASKYPFAN